MKRTILCLLCALTAYPVFADQPTQSTTAPQPLLEAKSSVTRHTVKIGSETVAYRAVAGFLIVKNAEEKPAAQFGYTAYLREGIDDPAERPLLFAFNGGPGSSSIWLHLGVLGPRRVEVADADFTAPPFQLIDNEYSILDVADVVMMDPVGTGYSRPVGEATNEDFWGVDQDIDSVSRFIKTYVSENNRWSSPKILLGESYGGMRAGGVSLALLPHGIALNGVVLVSPYMSWDSGSDGIGIDLPHVLYLPTLAATAWYHGVIDPRPDDVAAFIEQVKAFAYDEYAPALLKGSRLTPTERQAVLTRLAQYTGVDKEYWDRANLRVAHGQFLKELLRDRRQTTGRIDSRYLGPMFDRLGGETVYDPMFNAIGPTFTAAFLDYYHNELEFGRDMEYRVSGGFWSRWDWSHAQPGTDGFKLPHPNTSVDLAVAMGLNPHMKVLVQQGYYDLATPQVATEYAIDHMDLSPEQRQRITLNYYEAGHMMYLHPPSLVKYKKDLDRFIRSTVEGVDAP